MKQMVSKKRVISRGVITNQMVFSQEYCSITVSLILSKPDYCSSLLAGLSHTKVKRPLAS